MYPAIIDTGSSTIYIPPLIFDKLQVEWEKALPDLKCTGKTAYCEVPRSCDQIKDKIKKIGFQMSGYIFELSPESFLIN